GTVLSILSTTTGSHGSATTALNGRLRVALAGWDALAVGETGTEAFTYRAVDDNGAETGDVAVTLTVQGRNDAPSAGAATATTPETTPVTAALVADDVDSDDDRT